MELTLAELILVWVYRNGCGGTDQIELEGYSSEDVEATCINLGLSRHLKVLREKPFMDTPSSMVSILGITETGKLEAERVLKKLEAA